MHQSELAVTLRSNPLNLLQVILFEVGNLLLEAGATNAFLPLRLEAFLSVGNQRFCLSLCLISALLQLVGVVGFHRPDLVLDHVDLVPDVATVLALLTDLLIARLDLLDDSCRFFEFQCELLDQAIFRLNLLHGGLILLAAPNLEVIGQSSIVLLQHSNVGFVRLQFLSREGLLSGRLNLECLDLLLQFEYLVLKLLPLLVLLAAQHLALSLSDLFTTIHAEIVQNFLFILRCQCYLIFRCVQTFFCNKSAGLVCSHFCVRLATSRLGRRAFFGNSFDFSRHDV